MKLALCGRMGSGKSHISKLLAQKYNLEIVSFGSKILKIL